jgi:hypothetical protein
MKLEKRIIKTLAAFALICGLSVSAHAQLGCGWTPDGETYTPQTSSGCTITPIPGGFEFSTPSGAGRAEQRGNNLPTNTTNQWEGFGTLKSFPSGSNNITMHQVFGPAPSTPDLILDEAHFSGGIEIMSLEQGDAFEAAIQVGVQFRMNTIYDPVGNLITIYVNGSQTGTKTPNSGVHYNKYGQYVSLSGTGPSTMDWVNIQSWAGGTAGGNCNPQVATPTFNPPAGTYSSAQTVVISTTTSGASIAYTTDGSTPTESGGTVTHGTLLANGGSVSVASSETLKAIGFKSGDTDSTVGTAAYTISQPQVATPTFNPPAGSYSSAQTVVISTTTSGASIAYTTDGSTPTESGGTVTHGTLLANGGSVSVASSETLKAIGFKSGDTDSTVGTAAYTIGQAQVATPTFNPPAGSYSSAQTVVISTTTSGASIAYTTDGSTPTESGGTVTHGTLLANGGSVSVASSETLKAIGFESGDADSTVGTAAYTIGGTCVTASAGGSWQDTAMSSQSGSFTATFDATPSASPDNAIVALSNGAQTTYTGFACLVRFNTSGDIDARNGGAYAAASTIPFSAGKSYHFRLVVNVSSHTYSIYVTPAGGTELTVGTNYAFRTEQNTVTSLNYWGAFVDSSGNGGNGTLTVCNFTATSGGGTCFTATAGGNWQDWAMSGSQSGTFTATCDATPSASPNNALVALSNGAQTTYTGFACLVRFNTSGHIDARNGGAYAAASTISFAAGSTYHFRLVVNVPSHTYSIFVTPPGGSELTVGSNYAFRTEQNTVTSLNYWGDFVDSSGNGGAGTLTVCNSSP